MFFETPEVKPLAEPRFSELDHVSNALIDGDRDNFPDWVNQLIHNTFEEGSVESSDLLATGVILTCVPFALGARGIDIEPKFFKCLRLLTTATRSGRKAMRTALLALGMEGYEDEIFALTPEARLKLVGRCRLHIELKHDISLYQDPIVPTLETYTGEVNLKCPSCCNRVPWEPKALRCSVCSWEASVHGNIIYQHTTGHRE